MIPLKDENPTQRRAVVTVLLIVVCVAVYFGIQTQDTDIDNVAFSLEFAAVPCEVLRGEPLGITEIQNTFNRGDDEACATEPAGPQPYPDKNVYLSILVSMFLHGSPAHLAFNMLFLWIFGNNIEDRLGHLGYLAFYLTGGVVATIAHIAVAPDSTIPVVGASGAIAAVMGAYMVWFPNAPIRTLVLLFLRDITAKWFLGAWFVLQFFTDNNSGVAWVAHVGGFVFGLVVGLVVRVLDSRKRRIYGTPSPPMGWDATGGAGRGPYPHVLDGRRPRLR